MYKKLSGQLGIHAEGTAISSRDTDTRDKVKLAAALESEIESFVNWGNKLLANVNTSQTKLFAMIVMKNHFNSLVGVSF